MNMTMSRVVLLLIIILVAIIIVFLLAWLCVLPWWCRPPEPHSDTTKPTIAITTPAEKATYALNEEIAAAYECADEPGGSGVKYCNGDVANGSPIDTSSLEAKSFKVDAEDNDGNKNSLTHNYEVGPGKTTELTHPTTQEPTQQTTSEKPLPKSGGLHPGSLLLPASAFVLGSGVLVFVVLRRR